MMTGADENFERIRLLVEGASSYQELLAGVSALRTSMSDEEIAAGLERTRALLDSSIDGDVEDRVLDVLDVVTGWCSPAQRSEFEQDR